MRGFAKELGWTPSYEILDYPALDQKYDHLIVEHGVTPAATFTFLPSRLSSEYAIEAELNSILEVSYNNMIDWHVLVGVQKSYVCNNRFDPPLSKTLDPLGRNPSSLRYSSLGKIFEDRPSRQRPMPTCDEVIIRSIRRWRGYFFGMEPNISDRTVLQLINSVFLFREQEDQRRFTNHRKSRRTLIDYVLKGTGSVELFEAIKLCSDENNHTTDESRLPSRRQRIEVERQTALDFFSDFYGSDSVPYTLNFHLLSKHALSRVYERYVSIMEAEDPLQAEFFEPKVRENLPRKSGMVYTPQFIAGFFARQVRDLLPQRLVGPPKLIDPTCGSGIFLRTTLEVISEAPNPENREKVIDAAFDQVYGLDRNQNAVEAARLSLNLLHLAITGELARNLQVRRGDLLTELTSGRLQEKAYNAVLANPPYIKLDDLSKDDRESYRNFIGPELKGRLDAYVTLSLAALRLPSLDGVVCLVLPRVFLDASNARILREEINRKFRIECIIDLNHLAVFEGFSIYNVLLVARRVRAKAKPYQFVVAKIDDNPGPALEAVLERREERTPYFDVFYSTSSELDRNVWRLMPRDISAVVRRMREGSRSFSDVMHVRQGLVSGADNVFIVRKALFPRQEHVILRDYLPDRQMQAYGVPPDTGLAVIYPAGMQSVTARICLYVMTCTITTRLHS